MPSAHPTNHHAAKSLARGLFLLPIVLLAWAWNAPAAANILTNPGFEADPPGSTNLLAWNIYGTNTYSETGLNAHSGSNYFKVYQAFTGSVNYDGIYQDNISGPGTAYSASGWAFTLSTDKLAGGNVAWIEVTFRDAQTSILALYRSALITTNAIASGAFPANQWINLPITNQYDPTTFTITNTTSTLVAPPGTSFVRYQIVFQGDANNSGGSVYFDDLALNQTAGAPMGNWNIVWSDEFSGSAINPLVWTFDLGNGSGGWGNNELEYYTNLTQNAYVSNGVLHIVARQQTVGSFDYTSARMKTQDLFWATYGRFEFRARLPQGVGFWPALWMLGTNITVTNIGWPGCGEIDVVENKGSDSTNVQGSIHSGSDATKVYTLPGGSVTNFHTYLLEWTTNAINWFVDGLLYENQTNWSSSVGPYPTPFNQPFFLIMNLAVGGNYLSNPSVSAINAGSTFPAEMQVDYIRIHNLTSPLQISVARSNNDVVLTWPTNIVCHLQVQTNSAAASLTTNWTDLTTATSPYLVVPTQSSGFYRLASP
jgi:beta-glucanase (GH16 family)